MTLFSEATIIVAGSSSNTPERDFVVQAGTSSSAERTFLVKYVKYFTQAKTLCLDVASTGLQGWNIQRGDIELKSELASLVLALRILELLTFTLQLSSSLASISLVNLVFGAIQVSGGNVEFYSNLTAVIEVTSSTSQVFQINLGSSLIEVGSPYETPSQLDPVLIDVSSSNTDFKYLFRIWTVTTHLLSISGLVDIWRMPAAVVECVSSTALLRYTARSWQVQPYVIDVSSSATNIIPINIECFSLFISSAPARLSFDRQIVLQQGAIIVVSSLTNLRDSTIRAATLTIQVDSSFSDFRSLPSGFLPSTTPTTRTFVPNAYSVVKTDTMSGRVVRRLMASQPVGASLTLEYQDVVDSEAEQVLAAYAKSYGSLHGFQLPSLITEGGSPELSNYIRLFNSRLKWFFDGPPTVQSVSKGLINIQIQLKARPKIR